MRKFSAQFVSSTFRPLRAATREFDTHVSKGLENLGREHLQKALDDAIDECARGLRVQRVAVTSALPSNELTQVLDLVEQRQKDARRSLGCFVGGLDGLVHRSAGSGVPASQRLRNVADKYALDKQIAHPMRALSDAIAQWEDIVHRAGEGLCNNPDLRAHIHRRRLRRAALGAGVLGLLGILSAAGTWHYVVVSAARQRIASVVNQPDPCVGETLRDHDLAYALPDQIRKLDEMKTACAQHRKREAYLTRCSELADSLNAGSLTDRDRVTAKDAWGLMERVVSQSLLPEDLTLEPNAMPCPDTPSHKQLWRTYARTAAGSAELWGKADKVSAHVQMLLTSEDVTLSEKAKETLLFRTEKVTRRAITRGAEPELKRARLLCTLVEQLDFPRQPWCKALDRLSKQK